MTKYEELKNAVAALEPDNLKFEGKGNASAGTRLRKGLQDIKRIAQEWRNQIQEVKASEK